MTISPITVANAASDAHQKLGQAHREAAILARLLNKLFTSASQPDLARARMRAVQLGLALHAVASAERLCGHCLKRDHDFSCYEEMLDHHRRAYLTFERLSTNLEDNIASYFTDTLELATKVGDHLDAAEAAHQASLLAPKVVVGSNHELH
jgi:hypothetical protein